MVTPCRRVRELRSEHLDYIAQKKSEAQGAIVVMERQTALKTAEERERKGASPRAKLAHQKSMTIPPLGLIILSADYGLASSFTDRGKREQADDEEVVIDVTIPVQALVQDSRLYIPSRRSKVCRSLLLYPDRGHSADTGRASIIYSASG